MDILPLGYFEELKRYWRRRKYHRLDDDAKNGKKLRVIKLGRRSLRVGKIKQAPKRGFRIVSPFKLLAKFHNAYIDLMISLAGDKDTSIFAKKKVNKRRPLPMVAAPSNDVVDGRMVMEIYRRVVSSRENSAMSV